MKCKGSGGTKRKYIYYTCEHCHINFNENHVELLLKDFIYDLLEYDMAVKKFFLPVLEDKSNNIDTSTIDKEIRELQKQRDRIKQAYIKGIVKIDDFKEDYKLIEDKLANLETKKLELINLEKFNYSPHELLVERDLEKEKMIRLDTLNSLLNSKWNVMNKSEKQEFISKFIDTIEIKKDNKGNLILEKINFRNGFVNQLLKFYDAGIFDVAVPVMINNEEDYIKGIEDVVGRVPVFGGSAADNTVEGKWSIYTGNDVFSDGAAIAFFYTDKEMENVFTGAYNETTNSGVITKIEGKRTLVEIDGKPALDKYSEWTEAKMKDLEANNLLVTTITKPLGVKDRLGDLIAIRHPMYGNKDKSMNIGANLAVNTAVIQMEATVDELINSTGNTMKELNNDMHGEVGAYLLVHCGGRRLGIGDRIDEVSKQLKEQAHGKPFIAVFTFGEYGVKDHGANTTGGLMLSFTAFAK